MDATQDGYFLCPNRLVDLGPTLRPHGVYLYCCIARCPTLKEYPTAADLAVKLRLSPARVDNLLERLAQFGLLSGTDLSRLRPVED